MSSEQDAVERLDEIRERAKYLKKYGERELYYYNPQEHKDLFFLLDRLEASQQEVERLQLENTVLWLIAGGMMVGSDGTYDELEGAVKEGVEALERERSRS